MMQISSMWGKTRHVGKDRHFSATTNGRNRHDLAGRRGISKGRQSTCAVTRRRVSSGCKPRPATAPAGSDRSKGPYLWVAGSWLSENSEFARLTVGGRWIRTIGPAVTRELCWRCPPLLPVRERERFSAIFCSASHSMEPIADVVWVGCGLSRCSAASALRRYKSNIPSLFIGSTSIR